MSDEPLPNSEIILYQTEDGRTRIQCRFENETLWLTQAQIAELFQTTPQNVTLHLKGIFAEGELDETATCKDYLQVRLEGGREVLRKLRHYRLEAILAVGFRVRSHRGTQFRQWATARLSEYLVKGFTMDDELQVLNRIVNLYIEYAELQALERKPMTMRDWITKLVFVDEAHRSQYGFEAKMDSATGEVSYGFAHYVRKGLPNATFVGFTGTPIEMVNKNTQQVFGDYIDVYDITQAVEDNATVPIHYEGKIVRLKLDDDTKVAVDAAFDEVTEGMEESEKARFAGKWSTLEALAGASERLDELAALIVDHFEKRQQAINGKGMIVCMSRRICVDLYHRITQLRPAWHDAADDKGKLKVVMTGSAADPQAYQPHVRNKQDMDNLAKRYRAPGDDFQLVIVRDMWLTGFDCPSMHTIYIDKPMHGHGLMQAIARVNRIFTGKPSGLVVDTIGIATDLKEALAFYSDRDRGNTGINTDEAVLALKKCLDVLRSMFHRIDYAPALKGNDGARLKILGQALNHVYGLEGEGEEAKKKARKRFLDAVAELERAFKLSSGRDEAAAVTVEVAFFCAIKIAMGKFEGDGNGRGRRGYDLDAAIERLVNQSVCSTEVIDLLSAAGIKSPDISVLSDEFLKEMAGMEHKNLAVEALRKLLAGETKSRTRTNVVKNRQFTERIEEAMARYHNRVIDALQVIEELIKIGRDLREEPDDGLTKEEVAFYDALAENGSATELMGNAELRFIASELVKAVRENSGMDWWRFDQRRKKVRTTIRRILRKYGYPPDLEDAAIRTVVLQAEALAAEVTRA